MTPNSNQAQDAKDYAAVGGAPGWAAGAGLQVTSISSGAVLMIVVASLAGLGGLASLSNATAGVGGLALACLMAILARVAQAARHHREHMYAMSKVIASRKSEG